MTSLFYILNETPFHRILDAVKDERRLVDYVAVLKSAVLIGKLPLAWLLGDDYVFGVGVYDDICVVCNHDYLP